MSPFTRVLPPAVRRLGLLALGLATLLPMLAGSMASMLLPALGADFAVPFASLQWVLVAYLLGLTCLTVVAGRLGDRFGQRRLLLWGMGLFVLASLLCALAPTIGWLLAARVLQGRERPACWCCRWPWWASWCRRPGVAGAWGCSVPSRPAARPSAPRLAVCCWILRLAAGLSRAAADRPAGAGLRPVRFASGCGVHRGEGSIWRVCRSCCWRCSATGWPLPRRGRWPSGWGRGAAGHRLAGAQ